MIEQMTYIAILGGAAGLVALAALLIMVYLALFANRIDEDPDTYGQNRRDHMRQAEFNRWEDRL